MLSYKIYRKLDKLAHKYVCDRYDYCGCFCNNNILDSLLSGKLTKQAVYERHLDYITELICQYSDLTKVIKENVWYGKLLLKYNYIINLEYFLDD